ncbi:MAG: hypothetical protein PHT75_03115 [Bacilli bacterium]|nr:hypothetical protein [Bacilli bacterium]MDD3305088.1 hypothetical protein [Bacilli bacterium]MDD4053452.1 hypothetical protein [Bacilli bacterium]MDD4410901.1 hypothetical protein [Bacilli bacterium]
MKEFNELKTPVELSEFMKDINYGWMDNKHQLHIDSDNMFANFYILQSIDQILENKTGVCWDQVELERHFFEKNALKYETYFLIYYNDKSCPTHTFLIFESNNSWFWFENSFYKHRGIHQYSDKNILFEDVKQKFMDDLSAEEKEKGMLVLYKYDKPNYGIGVSEFCQHCERGIIIN